MSTHQVKRRSTKRVLNKEEVNKLRLEHTDTEIIKILKTSFGNINEQCGTREENGIPLFIKKREISHEKKQLREQLEKELAENSTIPELKSTKHEYPKVENYWENVGELIEIGTRAIPFTYQKIGVDLSVKKV